MLDLPRRSVDVDGVQTSYVDQGDGSPIVLIHGGDPGRGSTGASIWHRNIPGLARTHRVVAPDRLGIGWTDNPACIDDYRMSRICAHVERFLDVVEVSGATVVGQSRGAFVAAHLARVRPDLVDRLVVVNSASFAPKRAAKRKVTIQNFQGLPETVEDDERWLSVGHGHITAAWVAEARAMLSTDKATRARRQFAEAAEAYYAEMETLKSDLLDWYRAGNGHQSRLIVWGVGDPSVGIQDGLDSFEVLRRSEATTRMYVIDRAGHHCFAEQPEEFNRQVLDFIRHDRATVRSRR
ncbi:alpha/beta fold hydrolase [Nocardioides nitrophenolicus]|uniref:alpha/beta fold hydrolase n=1 Tax=Nocardioides nitrophenolicus TaxID=60489 RepID=UPI00195E3544|nr:alpha/beta hydrolase [Nocardioides nitrophenolicus]MBM7516948.1 pimeloyl-ACP methyl ester carboxylesterase [Nocardioides nitrophenolicus]